MGKMTSERKQELKNKLNELLQEKLAKFRNRVLNDEFEEEKVVEPFLLLEPDEVDLEELVKYCEEEGLELHFMDEAGEIHEFKNLSDVLNPEACPSVEEEPEFDIDEEEIEYIPINEVELDEQEIQELNEVAEDIKPMGIIIPCEVNGKEKLLIETVNCNIKAIPLLGIYLVAPINIKFIRVLLDADMQSDEEIEVEFIFENNGEQIFHCPM